MLDMFPGQQEHGSVHHPALDGATPLRSQHLPLSSGTPQSPGTSSESCAACEPSQPAGHPIESLGVVSPRARPYLLPSSTETRIPYGFPAGRAVIS
jgi:hypothetical protein